MPDQTEYEPTEFQLIKDHWFRLCVPIAPTILYDLVEPYYGPMWRGGQTFNQPEFAYGGKRIQCDAAIRSSFGTLCIEMHRYQSKEEMIATAHRRMCLCRLSVQSKKSKPEKIYTIQFTDRHVTGGLPFLDLGGGTQYGFSWPDMRLKLVDVTLPQLTTAQNDICNDILATDLRYMRNQNIINAFKEAFKESRDPMKELYNRYERRMIEKGRAEAYSQLIDAGKNTLSDVSEVTGRSEESLQSAIDAFNKRR